MLKNQTDQKVKNKSFDIDAFIENFSDIDMYQKNFFLTYQKATKKLGFIKNGGGHGKPKVG